MTAVAASIPQFETLPAANGLKCTGVGCAGHDCQASRIVEGKPLCIWCLDDLPCPVVRKRKNSPPAPGGENLTPEKRKRKKMPTPSSAKVNGHDLAAATVAVRKCKCSPDCPAVVPASFRFCYAPGHRHKAPSNGKKRGKKPAARVTPVTSVTPITPAAPIAIAPAGSATKCALQVTERQLDRFLTRLTFDEKQHLANYYLANVDDAA